MPAFEEVFEAELEGVPDEFFDREQFVPGTGEFDADVVFVGEAPGEKEVEEGEPFVGPAGRRLDSLLEPAGIDREEVYITNLVKIRPPENRDPYVDEIDAWYPVLEAEIDYIEPAVIVTLGAFAGRELLGTDETVEELRSEDREYEGVPVVATYHPAATFYDDSTRPALEDDLRKAAELADPE